jgi:hypothetical protein
MSNTLRPRFFRNNNYPSLKPISRLRPGAIPQTIAAAKDEYGSHHHGDQNAEGRVNGKRLRP